jgi:hypothetical protein
MRSYSIRELLLAVRRLLATTPKSNRLPMRTSASTCLLLGPGTTVTHDAVRHCAHGTALAFVGTDGTRIYTAPPIFDRDADLARRQATYWACTTTRAMVAKRMYSKRFGETPRTNSLDFKPMAFGIRPTPCVRSWTRQASYTCRRARPCQGAAWKRRSVRPRGPRRPTLTGSCARRPQHVVGRGEETRFQVEQRNWNEGKNDVKYMLDSKAPYKACSVFTRVTACTLALSPIRDTLIEGFSHFVTSMTASIASG